jgi:LmbE family N-acetylglucosaminyl deacetylase
MDVDRTHPQILDDPLSVPLLPPETVTTWGPTLVVAPHPDDESIGCGGAIRILRQANIPVWVIYVSDGTGSHPSSRAYPPDRLRAVREAEALDALDILGVDARNVTFMRLPDRFVPRCGTAGFSDAVVRLQRHVASRDANDLTVLVPWRRDPHCDHRAAWEIVVAALPQMPVKRVIEYPIWLREYGEPPDFPLWDEAAPLRLDIAQELPAKLRAINAHRSQVTGLIDDDPDGFRLTPTLLERFTQPWEFFLESPIGTLAVRSA